MFKEGEESEIEERNEAKDALLKADHNRKVMHFHGRWKVYSPHVRAALTDDTGA